MLRILFRLLLFLVVICLLILAVGPLLVNPNPAPGASSPKSVAAAESRFVDVPFPGTGAVTIHYMDSAPDATGGRTFVLLHGFTFNLFTWNKLQDFFARQGRVVAYDQLPYGLSDKLVPGSWQQQNPYSKAAALEQLFALLDAIGVGRAVLVGNSSGGTLALEAALARPDRVEALILLAPWVHANRPIFPDFIAGLPQMERLSLLLARYLGGTSPLLDYSYADPSLIDDERRSLTGIHRKMANWDVAWAGLLNHSLTDPVEISAHLQEIRQPVLVITGADDHVVPVEDTMQTARELPSAHFGLLPGCGHLAQEECPQLVEKVIADWLPTLDQREQ